MGTATTFLRTAIWVFLGLVTQLPGATFTVNKTTDSGSGTLRQAILDANATTNLDTIVFNLSGGGGVKTISPLTPLPLIGSPVIIDGGSQGGAGYAGPPLIEISGAACLIPCNGLQIHSGGNTIRGLIINRFTFNGIMLVTNGFNTIQGNYIGTDQTGTVRRGNTNAGISIEGSPNNLIGGSAVTNRNVISGNYFGGINLVNSGARSNVIQGNHIGVDKTGTVAVPNEYSGINLTAAFGTSDYPTDNLIGGARTGNLISGNEEAGIWIGAIEAGMVEGPSRNRIIGNFIGTATNGLTAIPNIGPGIYLTNATANIIGGTVTNEGNVISGNIADGILIEGGRSNIIHGNTIGLNFPALAPLANLIGVSIHGGSGNTIGGISNRSGNVISGNQLDGVQLGFGTTNNQVSRNIIGFSGDGLIRVPNLRHGVGIFDSSRNTVGILPTNITHGINFIMGNGSNGVFVGRGALNSGSFSNRIQANLIATNGLDGIQLSGGANGNQVLGNVIGGGNGFEGTTLLGNGRHGVAVFDSTNNVIGGDSADDTARNAISGNRSNGIFLGKGPLASGSYSNTVQGNQIGNNVMGNGGAGVFVQGSWNTIGSRIPSEGNRIGYNGTNLLQRGHGVVIESGAHNGIFGNGFARNAGRAIDLGHDSFTVNDLGDEDTGANDLQNYPVVTRVSFGQFSHEVTWTLNSKSNRVYSIEIYSNSEPDPSGFGEGESLFQTVAVQTDTAGFHEFTTSFIPNDLKFISATATDLEDMNTSEFSPVDTDGDAIADAWEAWGIDYDEDGTNDLTLAGANWERKDIYVEIDAMEGRAPNMQLLGAVNHGTLDARGRDNNDGFLNAPADLVQNPNGEPGVFVHMELDETDLPLNAWTNHPTDPMFFFDTLKSNYFGTVEQFTNVNALKAKQLVYHYCIFADTHPDHGGRARDFLANDFYLVKGVKSSSPNEIEIPKTFMHELGHCLGLKHGGADHDNHKPNYHSIMNYGWSSRLNSPLILDFSRTANFATLNETNLDESIGVGGPPNHANHTVVVGPYQIGTNKVATLRVPEFGPVDWNGNGTSNDVGVARDLNYLPDEDPSPGEDLRPSEDWSRLRYYFRDARKSVPQFLDLLTNDLNPRVLEELEKLGTGVGQFQFSLASYTLSETGGVTVISVRRIFEAEGNVSVSFATVSETATSGLDYVATNGVLNFTGSESVKIFTVPILNDGSAEQVETFQLILSNPTGGATLGHYDQATLTIVDDDPPGHYTVINTNNSGAGSLRQAILDANASSGIAIIDFNVPGPSGLTISPTTALPTITNILTIDGTTQPGFAGSPIIELNGASAGSASGLSISAGRCTVRGLVINRFTFYGITLTSAGGNRIEGCYIGLNRQGTLDQGNGGHGINVLTPNNVIGGLTLAVRNYVSGNNGSGIEVSGVATNNLILGNVIGLGVDGSDQGNSASGISIAALWNTVGGFQPGARNVISGNNQDGVAIGAGIQNRVLGNFIGTDLTGLVGRGNSSNGVSVSTTSHIIGGGRVGEGNLISGNGRRGISLFGSAHVVLGNRIGTDISGELAMANQQGGILLNSGSQSNRIGDVTQFAGNTIAFNNGPGVFVSSASASNNVIRGNAIHSHPSSHLGIDLFQAGISLNDTNDTDVGANQLQNHPALFSASNSLAGTFIQGSLNSRPNTNYTIDFYASVAPDPSGWGEGQSWIGSTTVTTGDGGNAEFGVQTPAIYLKGQYVTATATDAAGNTSEFSPPVVSGSTIPGRTFTVFNVNDSGEGSLRQAILDANAYASGRDTIEFDIPGSGVHTITPLSALPDITDPVLIDGYTQPGASPNTALTGHNGILRIELNGSLAGNTPGLRVLGGNSIIRGLVINRFASTSFGRVGGIDLNSLGNLNGVGGNRVEGNFIGTDPTGTLDRGNVYSGVSIQNCSSNVIGGTLPEQRNVISGTDHIPTPDSLAPGNGIRLDNTSGNRIEGNLIGTAADGISPLRNDSYGVQIGGGNHTIGGTNSGAGNVIAFNGTWQPNPVFLFYGGGVSEPNGAQDNRNAILGNSIHSNIDMGIDGDHINSFDRGHFPFLSSAISSNGILALQGWLSTAGRLNTVTNTTHRIEFFVNNSIERTGYGEGERFLGWTNATTDADGFATFTAALSVSVTNGQFITATSTDDRNNTSEFSPRLRVGDVLTNVIVVNSANQVDDGIADTNHTSLREAIFAANNHLGPDLIRFAIGSGARTIGITNVLPALMDPGTTLDATTQPGFTGNPLIYLDGNLGPPTGLRLYSPSNTVRGFAINRFQYGIYSDGIYGWPIFGNVIEGNYLGSDLTGKPNAASLIQEFGIYLSFRSVSNRIGGTSAAARNVISGNRRAGILSFFSEGNVIQGNYIGTDVTGTNVHRNGVSGGSAFQPLGGVALQQSVGTVVGGPEPGARNVIAGNDPGQLSSDRAMIVENNFISTDVTGTRLLSLGGVGIGFAAGSSVIRSNLTPAMGLYSSNLVEGNLIGTDATGTQTLISTFAGFLTGIAVTGSGNVIGGTNAAARNVVAAQLDGIVVTGTDNIVQGNFVGTKADGVSPLGNVRDGIVVQASRNRIGGLEAGARNIVAFNTNRGIAVTSGTGNAVLGNFIFANTGLGIDLGATGVTTNDFGDFDAGANNLQNFPLLSAARNIGSATIFQGTLNSRSNTSFRIEFFGNTNCHSSGQGQGRTFLNATTATTDSAGNAAFSFNHPAPVPAGQIITATATDTNNNTSEFSPCVAVINDTNYVVLSFTTLAPYALSWPASAVNFGLERATNLTPPVIWQTISGGITTNGGSKIFVVTNDPASPAQFFRLQRP